MVTSTMRRVKAMAFFATRLLSVVAKVGGGSYRGVYAGVALLATCIGLIGLWGPCYLICRS